MLVEEKKKKKKRKREPHKEMGWKRIMSPMIILLLFAPSLLTVSAISRTWVAGATQVATSQYKNDFLLNPSLISSMTQTLGFRLGRFHLQTTCLLRI